MQLDKYQRKHKKWLALQREADKLWQQIKDQPYIEVEPFQRGWKVKFVLREDIARRADAHILQSILDTHMFDWVTHNVHYVRAIRAGKKVYVNARGKTVDLSPRARRIGEHEYEKLSDEQKKWFELEITSEEYRKWGRKRYYPAFPNYFLKLKARPNIITHVRQKGGELDAEYEQLRHQIWYSEEFLEFQTNYGTSYPRHKDRTRTRDKIAKFKKGEIEDIYNERVPREYDY